MRCLGALLLTLMGSALAGCNKEPAKAPENKGGVNVTFPGGSVNTGIPEGGVGIKVPGVDVKAVPPK